MKKNIHRSVHAFEPGLHQLNAMLFRFKLDLDCESEYRRVIDLNDYVRFPESTLFTALAKMHTEHVMSLDRAQQDVGNELKESADTDGAHNDYEQAECEKNSSFLMWWDSVGFYKRIAAYKKKLLPVRKS